MFPSNGVNDFDFTTFINIIEIAIKCQICNKKNDKHNTQGQLGNECPLLHLSNLF